MSIKMEDLPLSERPYEKLELYGEKSLSNAELLAIIIKTGTKEESAVVIAQKILSKITNDNNLRALKDVSIEELTKIKGIGKIKAIQIKAALELATRISRPINKIKIKINSSDDAANLLMEELRYEKREIVKLLMLDNKNTLLKVLDISLGRNEFCYNRTKECFIRTNKNECTKDNFNSQSPKSEILLLAKVIF